MRALIINGLRTSWGQSSADLPIASYSRDEVFEIAADRLYIFMELDINKAFFAMPDKEKEEIKLEAFKCESYE